MGFWQELRRRRVHRMVGFYVVGAWLVLQVADVFFPAWGLPETAMRFLIVATILCFPIALVFSWTFDITTSGIVKTEPADSGEIFDNSLKRTDYVVLVALLAIGGAIVFGSLQKIVEEVDDAVAAAEKIDNSVAVLPFVNLDTNPDTGYFSDGITEEILDRLSSLKALHVLASNSSFAFRDSEESLAQIQAKLGVRYLLQGSIRRENDFVRVTARLIDEDGFQVWSEQFDRQLESIFAIQTEIASNVANQIIHEIVPLKDLPAGRTTSNMEAYDNYLVARAFLDARTENWRSQAIDGFQKAIELDPGFAPPYASLAMATTVMRGLGPIWEEGRALAEKAIELDNDLAEGHAALGLMLMVEGKLQEAILSLRRALELNSSLGFTYNILAGTLDRIGQAEEAMEVRKKGMAVDPLNPPLVANIAAMESRAGNFERAEQLLQRLLSLPEPPPLALGALYFLYDSWGRFADAVSIAKKAVRESALSKDIWGFEFIAWAYGNLGMSDDADYWSNLALEIEQDDLSTLGLTYNLLRTRAADSELGVKLQKLVNQTDFQEGEHDPWILAQFGFVNIYMGNFEKGSQQLDYGIRLYQADSSHTELNSRIDLATLLGDPNDIMWAMHQLAFAYQQIDKDDEADTILRSLTDEFGLEPNAMHYALLGDTDGALQAMRSTQESGQAAYYGPNKYYEIINDPAWAETVMAPGFQTLLLEMKEEVDRQRAIVETIEAEHDFRAEIEQLITK